MHGEKGQTDAAEAEQGDKINGRDIRNQGKDFGDNRHGKTPNFANVAKKWTLTTFLSRDSFTEFGSYTPT